MTLAIKRAKRWIVALAFVPFLLMLVVDAASAQTQRTHRVVRL